MNMKLDKLAFQQNLSIAGHHQQLILIVITCTLRLICRIFFSTCTVPHPTPCKTQSAAQPPLCGHQTRGHTLINHLTWAAMGHCGFTISVILSTFPQLGFLKWNFWYVINGTFMRLEKLKELPFVWGPVIHCKNKLFVLTWKS